MNRVFQTNVNQPTQELVADALKAMMEHPANNALIDNYRENKRRMAEAEVRQAVDELVTDFLASEGYKKWLAKVLKADERRRKKHMPSDDLQRVKLYIAQLKSSLPAVIPTVTHFDESKDRWGRIGLWRLQANGYLSGLDVVDGDHVPNPEALVEEWLQRKDFNDLGIVWIFITPSGEGVKVVFKAREEGGNLIDNSYQMADILGILDYADSQTKNSDHAHFIPKMSDVKYIDWEGLFTYENPAYEARYGEAYRRGESEPTMPRWQELERQRKEARKQASGAAGARPSASVSKTSAAVAQQTDATAVLSEEDEAFIKVLNEYYGPSLPPHTKHDRMQTETSHWLCYYNDNDAQKAIAMAYRLDWVKDWNPNPGEVEDLCQSAAKKKLLTRYPKALKELMDKAGINLVQPTAVPKDADPMGDLPFDKWCDEIEALFDEFPCLREVCEPHPRRLWPFLLFASAAMMGTCMTLTYYHFYANPAMRCRLNYIILGVGDPTSGKGTLDRLMNLLLAPILEADEIADQDTNDWKEKYDASSSNKEKETRHKIYNRFFGPRTSNTEFIRSPERMAYRRRVLEVLEGIRTADDLDILTTASELVVGAKAPLDAVRAQQERELEENADFLAASALRRLEARNKSAITMQTFDYLAQLTSIIRSWLRDVLMVCDGMPNLVINADALAGIQAAARATTPDCVAKALRAVDEADDAIAYNVSLETCIDVLLFDIREALYETHSPNKA